MAKKTVIGRACKMIINSSDDAWLYEGKNDEMDVDVASRQREAAVASGKVTVEMQEADYEDVTNQVDEQTGEIRTAQTSAPALTTEDDGPGY